MRSLRTIALLVLSVPVAAAVQLAACGHESAAPQLYPIGGVVVGLEGTLILQTAAGDSITITQDGAFLFAKTVQDGSHYAVTAVAWPAQQVCTIKNAVGVVDGKAVTTLQILCSTSGE